MRPPRFPFASLLLSAAAVAAIAGDVSAQVPGQLPVGATRAFTRSLSPPVLVHGAGADKLKLTRDEQQLWSCAGTLRCWSTADGTLEHTIAGPRPFADFEPLPDGRRVVTVDRPEVAEVASDEAYGANEAVYLRVWDVSTARELASILLPFPADDPAEHLLSMVAGGETPRLFVAAMGANSSPGRLLVYSTDRLKLLSHTSLPEWANDISLSLHLEEGENRLLVWGDRNVSCLDADRPERVLWTSDPVDPPHRLVHVHVRRPVDESGQPTASEVVATYLQYVERLKLGNVEKVERRFRLTDGEKVGEQSAVERGEHWERFAGDSRSGEILGIRQDGFHRSCLSPFLVAKGRPPVLVNFDGGFPRSDVPFRHSDEAALVEPGPRHSECLTTGSRYCAATFVHDSRIVLHDLQHGEMVGRWSGAGSGVEFSSGPAPVVVSGEDSRLLVAADADAEPCRIEAGAEVLSVSVSRDGRWCAAGTADGSILVLDRTTNRVDRLTGHRSPVDAIRIDSDPTGLFSFDRHSVWKKWRREDGEWGPVAQGPAPSPVDESGWHRLQHLPDWRARPARLGAFSPDGTLFATFDAPPPTSRAVPVPEDGAASPFALFKGRWSLDRNVTLTTGTRWENTVRGYLRLIATRSGDIGHGKFHLVDSGVLTALSQTDNGMIALAIRSDGEKAATRCHVFDGHAVLAAALTLPAREVADVALSPDGDLVAVSYRSGELAVYEVATKRLLYETDLRVPLRELAFHVTPTTWRFGLTSDDAGTLVHIVEFPEPAPADAMNPSQPQP